MRIEQVSKDGVALAASHRRSPNAIVRATAALRRGDSPSRSGNWKVILSLFFNIFGSLASQVDVMCSST